MKIKNTHICEEEDEDNTFTEETLTQNVDDIKMGIFMKGKDDPNKPIQMQLGETNNHELEENTSSSINTNTSSINGDNILIISHASPLLVKEPIIHCDSRKKLIVLDLNGLLVDMSGKSRRGFKRPFCDDFLKFCFERFNVGVWSSRVKKNVNKVVNFVMGDLKDNLIFTWDVSYCTQTGLRTVENKHKPLVLKELKKLWDKYEDSLPWEKGTYNESNTLLLDDSPYKALRNPLHTAIFPSPFTHEDINDNSLGLGGDLRVYLEGLVAAENVPKYIEQHPFGQPAITNDNQFWDFYCQVVGTQAPGDE